VSVYACANVGVQECVLADSLHTCIHSYSVCAYMCVVYVPYVGVLTFAVL